MSIQSILQSKDFSSAPVTSIGIDLPVNWSAMNDETIARLAWHGLKQKINDPNGAKSLTDDEKLANSQKVIDALERNEFRMQTTRESDPVAREITKLATAKANEHFKKLGIKAAQIDADDWKTVLGKFRAHPKLVALAEANVKALQAADIELKAWYIRSAPPGS